MSDRSLPQTFLADLGMCLMIGTLHSGWWKPVSQRRSEVATEHELTSDDIGVEFEAVIVDCWVADADECNCTGSLLEPGHGLFLGPCRWTQPSLWCSCRMVKHTLHWPLRLLQSWDNGQLFLLCYGIVNDLHLNTREWRHIYNKFNKRKRHWRKIYANLAIVIYYIL